MFEIVEPYSGHFYDAEYLEYDQSDKSYKVPVLIKLKGYAGIGVSTGVKEIIKIEDMNGRWVEKEVFTVHTVNSKNYKLKDKIRDLTDGRTYIIARVSDDINHQNAITNVMFNGKSNRPKILYLGDR